MKHVPWSLVLPEAAAVAAVTVVVAAAAATVVAAAVVVTAAAAAVADVKAVAATVVAVAVKVAAVATNTDLPQAHEGLARGLFSWCLMFRVQHHFDTTMHLQGLV